VDGLEYTCTRNFRTTIAAATFKTEADCISRLSGPRDYHREFSLPAAISLARRAITQKRDINNYMTTIGMDMLSPVVHPPFRGAPPFLEQVEDPAAVVAEAARVLRPGGTFFFHTFNRNLLAWLVVIKGVEWFVKNTPRHMHLLQLFVKPEELRAMCEDKGLSVVELHGSAPVVWSKAFFRMLATRVVPPDFRFMATNSLLLGYTGFAVRR
jgi:SAM-dependent methyltransferase